MSSADNTKPEAVPDIDPTGRPEAGGVEQPLSSSSPAPEQSGEAAALRAELERMKDHALRALAEAENTRKRAAREREDAAKYAVSSFAKDLLEVAGNFRRAIESIPEELKAADERVAAMIAGIEAIEREMLGTFNKHGILKIMPMDLPFDPNFHEVMFEAPVPGKAAGTVIQIIEPGYMLNGRLLRAAKVGIARGDGNHQVDTEA